MSVLVCNNCHSPLLDAASEAARDEWSAMEAVVHLELLLEAEGLLIEERTAHASAPGQDRFRAA
jgi:hypothetical protein